TLTAEASMLSRADVVFFCVPTPVEEGRACHEAVRSCAAAFAVHGRSDTLVILESTVRPGFVSELRSLLGHGGQVALAYAPERIDPQRSQAGMRLRDIPRLVAGVDDAARDRAALLLWRLGVMVHPVSLAVAEYAKLLENAYRLLNIAFIDQLAELCRAEGIDVVEVIEAAATKPFGYQAFYPGIGAGGHCIGVDPGFLVQRASELGVSLSLLEGALCSNAQRPRDVAAVIAARTAPGDVLLVIGLTYKPGVADIRESSSLIAARALSGMGRQVMAFDALVPTPGDLEGIELCVGLERATAVVLLVRQPDAVMAALSASGLPVFDATGSLSDAVEV
ncbi:MAG: UDP-N-acetyl-D-glucosamine dehydrogenase, partial [Myxococcota bacterium]